jgi:hypothetical protein
MKWNLPDGFSPAAILAAVIIIGALGIVIIGQFYE